MAFFGVNFILQKFCWCKKMTNIRYVYSLPSYLKKLHKNKLIPSRWMCGTQQYFKMSLSLAPVKNHWAILFAGVFISVRRNHKTQLLLIILYTKKWNEWIWCYILSPSTVINYLPPQECRWHLCCLRNWVGPRQAMATCDREFWRWWES